MDGEKCCPKLEKSQKQKCSAQNIENSRKKDQQEMFLFISTKKTPFSVILRSYSKEIFSPYSIEIQLQPKVNA